MKTTFLKLFAITSVISLAACESESLNSENYNLDEAASSIEWKGHSPNVYHDGSFAVKGGRIEVVDGILQSGTFTIPIVSIQNFDLPENVKPVLLNHLKSPDFFNMAVHPNASFKITKVVPVSNATGENNFTVTGNFTMLGETHPVTFPAVITLDGEDLDLDAEFEIDRTQWGMDYAADPELGEHHIKPEVDIKLSIQASKQ